MSFTDLSRICDYLVFDSYRLDDMIADCIHPIKNQLEEQVSSLKEMIEERNRYRALGHDHPAYLNLIAHHKQQMGEKMRLIDEIEEKFNSAMQGLEHEYEQDVAEIKNTILVLREHVSTYLKEIQGSHC